MIVYVLTFVVSMFCIDCSKEHDLRYLRFHNKRFSLGLIFLWTSSIIMIIVSTIRGDFTSDYRTYANIYRLYHGVSINNFLTIRTEYEPLFAFANWVLNIFSDDSITLFSFCSIVIVISMVKFAKDYSLNWGLSLALFLTVGTYYPSFNVMRQVLAAAMCTWSFKYLKDGNLIKYCAIIIFAGLFHRLSFIMLPFYFVLRTKKSFKQIAYILIGTIIVSALYDSIALRISSLLNFNYSFGSTVTGMQGGEWKSAVIYAIIGLFVGVFGYKFSSDNILNRIWYNGTLIWSMLYLLSVKFQFSIRLSYYFFPFVMIAVPEIIEKDVPEKYRKICIFIIVLLVFAFFYNAYSGSKYNPYYTSI